MITFEKDDNFIKMPRFDSKAHQFIQPDGKCSWASNNPYIVFDFWRTTILSNANRRSPTWWHFIRRSQCKCNFFSISLPQYSHRLVSSQKVLDQAKAKGILRVIEQTPLIFECSRQLYTETFLPRNSLSLLFFMQSQNYSSELEKPCKENNMLGLTSDTCQLEQD